MRLILIAVVAMLSAPAIAQDIEPNGLFLLPLECQTQNEIVRLEKGELGDLYFEIQTNSSCRFIEDLDNTVLLAEECKGPAVSVTFLNFEKKPIRQTWLQTDVFLRFIHSENFVKSCANELVRWRMEQRQPQ